LKANLRGGKGSTFMVGPGRHLASLRHYTDLLCKLNYHDCLTVLVNLN